MNKPGDHPTLWAIITSRVLLLNFVILSTLLVGCSLSLPLLPLSRQVRITEYPPLDWGINGQRLKELGCEGELQESCPELAALGCAEIHAPRFHLGGLQPPYNVVECVHNEGQPADTAYFRLPPGLDNRYRTYVVYQDGLYRLMIKQSEFRQLFAPVESPEEALSYAMAMTGLQARFDLDPSANVDYLVDEIQETHVEETPQGYLVYLFDWSHKMGCDRHPFYAVNVLVTREGDVREVDRQEIYRGKACFDFGALILDED